MQLDPRPDLPGGVIWNHLLTELSLSADTNNFVRLDCARRRDAIRLHKKQPVVIVQDWEFFEKHIKSAVSIIRRVL